MYTAGNEGSTHSDLTISRFVNCVFSDTLEEILSRHATLSMAFSPSGCARIAARLFIPKMSPHVAYSGDSQLKSMTPARISTPSG